MARGRIPPDDSITADQFRTFFIDKVSRVRASTTSADSLPLGLSDPLAGHGLLKFEPTENEVMMLIRRLPNKQCSLDPIPTWLLKEVLDAIVPRLTVLFNSSLTTGIVPDGFKLVYVSPLLKKTGLDQNEISSYRPISNLSVVSKLLERLVLSRVLTHLYSNNLFPVLQSAYRSYHD